MKSRIVAIIFAVLAGAAFQRSEAQAAPTATRSFQLSAFGGLTGVFTGFGNGRNLSITAGGDITFRTFYSLHPSLEVRGMYPVDSGGLVDEKNVLGGVKLARYFGRIHPYGDVLFGRGAIDYIGGEPNPTNTIEYLENPSNVLSGGGGIDLNLTEHFGVKADAQYQRYSSPVTPSGYLYSKPLTLAVIYRFNFEPRHHKNR